MSMSDYRLKELNQMILAVLFGVGLLAFLFVLVLVPQRDLNQVAVTMISNLLSVLGTVVVMQNTHFFKTPEYEPTSSQQYQSPNGGVPSDVLKKSSVPVQDAPPVPTVRHGNLPGGSAGA